MKPEVGEILALSVQRLVAGVSEHGAAFAQGQMGLIATMLRFSAAEYDRAADIRVAENADLRALFGDLAPQVSDAALRDRLLVAAGERDASLRISVLNESNYLLRQLLTALQVDAENRGDREAEKRIWAVLKTIASRRIVPLG